jgi:hypothetical protein
MKFDSRKQIKDFVFVYESGINYQNIKEYAWSEKGIKVIGERSEDVCHRRTTVIADNVLAFLKTLPMVAHMEFLLD